MENNENGVKTPNEGAGTQQQPVDYEKEFKALTDKYNSLNNDYIKKSDAYDKVSSENADYKRKEREKLSDEQKKAQEFQDLIDSNTKLQAQLQTMQLEKDILGAGFTNDECKKLMDSKMSVQSFAEILKERLEANEKSIRASLIKDTTPSQPMGNGTTNGSKGKTDFQLFQEKKAKETANGKVEF